MNIEVAFVRSAAGAADLPHDHLAEVAMVGRSNVGKSTLINALVRRGVARTSAAPGKTRLANIYRVVRGSGRVSEPFYLVDLPGYGYARGGAASAGEFARLTTEFFETDRANRSAEASRSVDEANAGRGGDRGNGARGFSRASAGRAVSALLLVDARHPGLDSDRAAWQWLKHTVDSAAIVATKIDKLARGERIRALRELQSVFDEPVLPVSAVTGEGLETLWKLIDKLAHPPIPTKPLSRSRLAPRPAQDGPSRPRAAVTAPSPANAPHRNAPTRGRTRPQKR